MNPSWKKVAVIVGVSLLIFFIFKPKKDGEKGLFSGSSKRTPIRKPILSLDGESEAVQTAYEALCAYIDAYNDGMKDSDLQDMKKEFKDQMGIEIYEDTNGKLAAKDTSGNDLLRNQ